MKGRPTKTTEKLKASGTYRPDRHKDRVEVETLTDTPPAPLFLSKTQKRYFEETAPKVRRLGVLAETDIDLLASYCIAKDVYISNTEICENKGYTLTENRGKYKITIQNPALVIAQKAFDQMLKISDRFGLSPVARGRLKIENGETPKDPMAELLKARPGGK